MDLSLTTNLTVNYHSASQATRIFTEFWVGKNMYCPRCGRAHIESFPNNTPVADFYCPDCLTEFELKSKNGSLGKKVTDGAYESMIQRITSNQNPDFFFMNYSKGAMSVIDFLFIPKHFFIPNIIERRAPLSENARRAGWIGCNILIEKIPPQGRIPIIANGKVLDAKTVLKKVNKSDHLIVKNLDARGWLIDVLNCINGLPTSDFSLNDIYAFEGDFFQKHPSNNNIKAKIRQQLQLLRDRGFIEFLGNGQYRKI